MCLRDGRLLLGTLAAYDQYANVALDAPVERVIVDGSYADVPAGAAVVIRGENVMLVGEVRGGVWGRAGCGGRGAWGWEVGVEGGMG